MENQMFEEDNLVEEELTAHQDLAKRSVDSVKWTMFSNIFQIFFGFLQSVLLARLLPIETFGVYAGASALTTLLGGLSNFGLANAFFYRCEETEDLERTAAVHFTLQNLISLIWTILMLAFGFIFIKSNDGYLFAFIVLTLCKAAANIANTPKLILSRSVQFKRVSIINIVTVTVTFVVSVILALLNQPLWALMTTNVVGFVVDYVLLYLWNPVWKPKFLWVGSVIRYFISFGSRQMTSRFLSDALDRTDDIWTKTFLGSLQMGFYSKAYQFALYPGKVISDPIKNVSTNTYAEIAHNREKLSDAFHKTNAFLIRSGFFLVGVLMVTAPEFIRVFLGARWLPMLTTFRLMLPFTLFDPMSQTMFNLFSAVGKPEISVKIRVLQLAVMVGGLFFFGYKFGIDGVALAVDIMMILGIIIVLFVAKNYVDYSLKKFFLFPAIGIGIGMVFSLGFDYLSAQSLPDILNGLIKGVIFSAFYFGVLMIFDRKEINSVINLMEKYLFKRRIFSRRKN